VIQDYAAYIRTAFHQQYYAAAGPDQDSGGGWKLCRWRDVPLHKFPQDVMTYARLLFQLRPRWVVELGTLYGGSALFFADVLRLAGGRGEVLTVDKAPLPMALDAKHVEFIRGFCQDPNVVTYVHARVASAAGPVLLTLDCDHTAAHVRAELDTYADLVTPGSYLVVEDGNLNGHPVVPEFGPGPAEALAQWLPDHPEFVPDPECEGHLITMNPGGWLRRVR
jgi:cephalosporin hydroxylase